MDRSERRKANYKGKSHAFPPLPNNAPSAVARSPEAMELLENGQALAELGHFEAAEKMLKKALQIEPDYGDLIDAYAEVLLDLGEADRAKSFLQKSIRKHGESVAEPYMYMGQLSMGKEAVAYLTKGIEIMTRQMTQQPELVAKICRGYCAIAELYMTDCCMEPEAESECERCMHAALSLDPENVEALQTLASIRISQQRPDEALQTLLQSIRHWHKAPKPERTTTTEEEDMPESEEGAQQQLQEEEEEDADEEALPYDFRIQTCKLLMELAQPALAIEILDRLVQEDAMMLGTWYLLAACHTALEHKDEAYDCAVYGMKIASESEYEMDPELVQQMRELAGYLGVNPAHVAEVPPSFLVRKYGALITDAMAGAEGAEGAEDDDDVEMQ